MEISRAVGQESYNSVQNPCISWCWPMTVMVSSFSHPMKNDLSQSVCNPAGVAAVKEMMKRGQPCLGAFLLQDENVDGDVITDINSAHSVSIFAQIISVFNAAPGPGSTAEEGEEGLTAVLYPHWWIRITDLIKAGSARESGECGG